MNWQQYLGYDKKQTSSKSIRPFLKAREYSRKLNLNTILEWREWTKTPARPVDIPTNPQRSYKDDGWAGWPDWLGTKNLSGKQKRESFLPFLEARAKVREKGFSSLSEFRKWVSQEKPLGIPYSPEKFYRDSGWVDTYDWRGVPRSHSLEFVSFSEAREFARSLGFKSTKEWQDWSKTKEKPSNIPATPDNVYRDKGWKGYRDFLGIAGLTNAQKQATWLPYKEARIIARDLELRSQKEWFELQKSNKY